MLFQQARIPVWERTQWPVLTDAGSIVWTRRFGAAAAVAAVTVGAAGAAIRRMVGGSWNGIGAFDGAQNVAALHLPDMRDLEILALAPEDFN